MMDFQIKDLGLGIKRIFVHVMSEIFDKDSRFFKPLIKIIFFLEPIICKAHKKIVLVLCLKYVRGGLPSVVSHKLVFGNQ